MRDADGALNHAYERLFDRDAAEALASIMDVALGLLVTMVAPPHPLRTDYSGSATAVVTNRRAAPLELLTALLQPTLMGICESLGYTSTIKSAKKLLQKDEKLAREFVRMALHDRVVLFSGRTPVIVGATIEIGDDPVIELDHETASQLGVKTGDTVALHMPITDAGQEAAKNLRPRSTPLPSASSWVQDVAFSSDPKETLLERARRRAVDPCTWPIAAIIIGGYEPSGSTAPRIELGPAPTQPQQEETQHPHLDRSVDELEMSVRTANGLQNAGITTIRELVQRTESDLLKGKNFGRKSLVEVKEILATLGLTLGMRL